MNRISFRRPTEHYDEGIKQIDEKICELIKQRKEISSNNPGYPPFEYITNWGEKFDLYENLLKSIFASLYNENAFKAMVEPEGFIGNLPVLKAIEAEDRFFSITYICQYSNCSVINLNIDWDNTNASAEHKSEHTHFKLFINSQYDCIFNSGTGGDGHHNYKFIVSPALPKDISGIQLIFKEYSMPDMDTPIGKDIIMQL